MTPQETKAILMEATFYLGRDIMGAVAEALDGSEEVPRENEVAVLWEDGMLMWEWLRSKDCYRKGGAIYAKDLKLKLRMQSQCTWGRVVVFYDHVGKKFNAVSAREEPYEHFVWLKAHPHEVGKQNLFRRWGLANTAYATSRWHFPGSIPPWRSPC